MKSPVIALCIVAYAYAISDQEAQVFRSYPSLTPESEYSYKIDIDQKVEVIEKEKTRPEIEGTYSYAGSDGKIYSAEYVGDDNGFHIKGHHLLTPPAPEANPGHFASFGRFR